MESSLQRENSKPLYCSARKNAGLVEISLTPGNLGILVQALRKSCGSYTQASMWNQYTCITSLGLLQLFCKRGCGVDDNTGPIMLPSLLDPLKKIKATDCGAPPQIWEQ